MQKEQGLAAPQPSDESPKVAANGTVNIKSFLFDPMQRSAASVSGELDVIFAANATG